VKGVLGALAFALVAAGPRPAAAEHPAFVIGQRTMAPQQHWRSRGIMLDAGLPDGVMASWVHRVDLQLRVHAGAGHNGIAPGARAGITLLALPTWISPSLTFELGHYARGDAQPLVDRLLGAQQPLPVLREVGYTWGNAHAGVELGRRRLTFQLHAGISYVHGTLRNVTETLGGDGPSVEVHDEPRVFIRTVSARAGLILWF
jgi:hypothetical protein